MTNDVRNACVALIRNGPMAVAGSGGSSPRPLALGWKLESGAVPARDLRALCAAMSTHLGAAEGRARWTRSPALRAFFAEYERVHGVRRRPRSRARCVR